MKTIIAVLAALVATLSTTPALAQGAPLFHPAPQARALQVPEPEGLVRSRLVEVDPAALPFLKTVAEAAETAPQRLTLPLFDDVTVEAERTDLLPRPEAGYTWVGRLLGDDGGSVLLTVGPGVVIGDVVTGDGEAYRLRVAGKGLQVVQEINPAQVEAELPPDPPPSEGLESTFAPHGADPEEEEALQSPLKSNTTIDALVLYTPGARNAAGGTSAIRALVDQGIATANQVYSNSGIAITLRLVHKAEISYTESGSMSTDRDRLRDEVDGHLDDAHKLRDLYGADITQLLTNQGSGIAYIMTSVSNSFRTSAFSVSNQSRVGAPNYTFTHEFGHIMSARHDWCVDSTNNSPYAYNHGYYNGTQWRTVMAYSNCCSGCGRIPHFSNPDVNYNGAATGRALTQFQPTHNALTLNNTRSTVAGFRETVQNDVSHEVHGFASCQGQGYECQILTREHQTVSGTVQVVGGGISGSWSQAGYRCGTSSTWQNYIEVYEDDTNHDWPWPDYCLQSGDTFTLQPGHTYDFRGPSVVGATPLPFSLQPAPAGNTNLELRATPYYRSGYQVGLKGTWNQVAGATQYRVTHFRQDACGSASSVSTTTGLASASGTHSNCGAPSQCYDRSITVEALNSSGGVITSETDSFCEVGYSTALSLTANPYYSSGYRVGLSASWSPVSGATQYRVTQGREDACGSAAPVSTTTGTASASGTHSNCGAPDLCYYRWVQVEALNSGGSVIAGNSNGFCEVGSP